MRRSRTIPVVVISAYRDRRASTATSSRAECLPKPVRLERCCRPRASTVTPPPDARARSLRSPQLARRARRHPDSPAAWNVHRRARLMLLDRIRGDAAALRAHASTQPRLARRCTHRSRGDARRPRRGRKGGVRDADGARDPALRVRSRQDRAARPLGARRRALAAGTATRSTTCARSPHGAGTAARTRLFSEIVDAYFEEAYAGDGAPDDLVHVTCTGYVSPSGAQQLVARTRLADARHARVSHGLLRGDPRGAHRAGLARIGARAASTSCTPSCARCTSIRPITALEQLVVQSLFADGLIRYSLVPERAARPARARAPRAARARLGRRDELARRRPRHADDARARRARPDRRACCAAFVIELYRARRHRARRDIARQRVRRSIPAGRRSSTACATRSSSPTRRSRRAARCCAITATCRRRRCRTSGCASTSDARRRARSSRASRSVPGSRVCGALFEKR